MGGHSDHLVAFSIGCDTQYDIHDSIVNNKIFTLSLIFNDGSDEFQIKINGMYAFPPGNGVGSDILNLLCSKANEYGVAIAMVSVAIGEPAEKREVFLKRFGFKPNGGGWYFRQPYPVNGSFWKWAISRFC